MFTARNFFTVLDLTNPAKPQRRGTLQTRVAIQLVPSPIALAGPFAYLVQSQFGLHAIDIRDPDMPRDLGGIDTPSVSVNVATQASLIYVTDQIFGLHIIRGPEDSETDTDKDSVIDYFDVFPNNPFETLDTDLDGIGDRADLDDDNDGFTDDEERQAVPPTDPKEPRSFPLNLPPLEANEIIVDAQAPPRGNGTVEAPYRSITTALRVLHSGALTDLRTLRVQAGTYSVTSTQEVFPLSFAGLSQLTIQGAGRDSTFIDAEFNGDCIDLALNTEMVIEGFTMTHCGVGLLANVISAVTLRRNRFTANIESGIELGVISRNRNIIAENIIHGNGDRGIEIFRDSSAMVLENVISENRKDGIIINSNASAEIMNNIIRENGTVVGDRYAGIAVVDQSAATVTANTVVGNGLAGLLIFTNSHMTVMDGTISENGRGVYLRGASTATIGIEGNPVEITHHTGAGILVINDGSLARIDSNNIIFDSNAGGDIVGPVIDVFQPIP